MVAKAYCIQACPSVSECLNALYSLWAPKTLVDLGHRCIWIHGCADEILGSINVKDPGHDFLYLWTSYLNTIRCTDSNGL